jgi:uroporphyrinogen decarboxylase
MPVDTNRATRFLSACRCQPVDTTPIWIMRQAGRYLPEYRKVRGTTDFLTLCKTPDLAAEVTLQPVDILGVDAAIIFSDILVPAEPMGLTLTVSEGEGPRIHNPVRSAADVERLVVPDPTEGTGYVLEALRRVRKALDGKVPLIGFAGAPFTLAAYAVEGGGSKNYLHIKRFMYEQPKAAHALFSKLADTVTLFLQAQVEAGAQAVQIFDSWGGVLSPADFEEYSLPYLKRIVDGMKGRGVPVILFGTDMGLVLEKLASTGADVVGLDWRINLDAARARLPGKVAVQGNLDPVGLFMPLPMLEARAADILQRNAGRPGHVFNLGHGILPETPVEHAKFLVETVHRLGQTKPKA